VWARERCRISQSRFLAECCKRQLNQGIFCCILVCLLFLICIDFVFSCTVLSASISQVIGCEDRLRNDPYCVEWSVKLYTRPTNWYLMCSATPMPGLGVPVRRQSELHSVFNALRSLPGLFRRIRRSRMQ